MSALRRPVVLTALAVVVVAAVMAAMSVGQRGSDRERLETRGAGKCAPIARDDAASTRPSEPVAIDVLRNDSDVDDDRIVLSVVRVSAGTASIDEAGTPKDARDDKVLYTPDEPSKPKAIVVYRVEDGAGSRSTARVAVTINEAVGPAVDVSLADPENSAGDHSPAGCTDRSGDSAVSEPGGPAVEADGSTDAPGSDSESRSQPTSTPPSNRATTTTVQAHASFVTPDGPSPSGGSDAPATTRPPSSPTTTTTRSTSTSDPDPPPCDYNDPTGQDCRDYGNGRRTTTTEPG